MSAPMPAEILSLLVQIWGDDPDELAVQEAACIAALEIGRREVMEAIVLTALRARARGPEALEALLAELEAAKPESGA